MQRMVYPDSVSLIVKLTKLVLGDIDAVKLAATALNDKEGAKLANTLTVTVPVPLLPYWSVNPIVDTNVSPLDDGEPLTGSAILKLPLLLIETAGCDDVNDATDGEPCDGE